MTTCKGAATFHKHRMAARHAVATNHRQRRAVGDRARSWSELLILAPRQIHRQKAESLLRSLETKLSCQNYDEPTIEVCVEGD